MSMITFRDAEIEADNSAFDQEVRRMRPARAPATLGEAWNARWRAAGLDDPSGLKVPLAESMNDLETALTAALPAGANLTEYGKARGLNLALTYSPDERAAMLNRIGDTLDEDGRAKIVTLRDVRGNAVKKAQQIEYEASEVDSRTYGIAGHAVAFIASAARQFVSPEVLFASAITAPIGGAGGFTARFVGRQALSAAAGQALVEPHVQRARGELELEHGFGRAVQNVIEAGAAGAVITTGLAGLLHGGAAAWRRLPGLPGEPPRADFGFPSYSEAGARAGAAPELRAAAAAPEPGARLLPDQEPGGGELPTLRSRDYDIAGAASAAERPASPSRVSPEISTSPIEPVARAADDERGGLWAHDVRGTAPAPRGVDLEASGAFGEGAQAGRGFRFDAEGARVISLDEARAARAEAERAGTSVREQDFAAGQAEAARRQRAEGDQGGLWAHELSPDDMTAVAKWAEREQVSAARDPTMSPQEHSMRLQDAARRMEEGRFIEPEPLRAIHEGDVAKRAEEIMKADGVDAQTAVNRAIMEAEDNWRLAQEARAASARADYERTVQEARAAAERAAEAEVQAARDAAAAREAAAATAAREAAAAPARAGEPAPKPAEAPKAAEGVTGIKPDPQHAANAQRGLEAHPDMIYVLEDGKEVSARDAVKAAQDEAHAVAEFAKCIGEAAS